METPLFHALNRHRNQQTRSYHTPGHKNGTLLPPALAAAWHPDLFTYDLTELPGLGNLSEYEGVLAESQHEAALSLHAHALRYLIGGSTLGLQAALLATCRNAQVFVPRHAHRSIYHALFLANALPVPLDVTCDPVLGIPLGVHPASLKKACAAHPNCRRLVLIHPTYHGFTWENEALMQVARECGLFTIADSAHGAHFFYHDQLPTDAYRLGCDLVISGAHKTLPVLTQSAILLVHDKTLLPDIDQALRLLQTTSPSYLLLLSLEMGLAHMAESGTALVSTGLAALARSQKPLQEFAKPLLLANADYNQDPFKWYLTAPQRNADAFAAALRQQGIETEMTDHSGVLLMLPLTGPTEDLSGKIIAAQRHVRTVTDGASAIASITPTMPPRACTLQEAWFGQREVIPLGNALGRIAADILDCYPPGIPLLVPGERITADLLTTWVNTGQSLQTPVTVLLEKRPTNHYNTSKG